MHFEGKNVILFLLEQGAIGCSGRHWVKNTTLKNIAFSFVADTTKVDVYKAEEVGKQILKSMVGKTINDFSFKCSNKTKTLVAQSNNAVKIGNDVLPQLLFQMITRAACE